MAEAGSGLLNDSLMKPFWLLAELSYRCPLRCFYCSNPSELAAIQNELSTEDWMRVLQEARELGAVQLGISGGEPLVRRDLEQLVQHASALGYYSNLITSGIGLSRERLNGLKRAGLDHIQLSMQASRADLNDFIAGARTFNRKIKAAQLIKEAGYPMVLNIVLHRYNIDEIEDILLMAENLEADYIELANTQYDGWAFVNRFAIMPDKEQVEKAFSITQRFQEKWQGKRQVYFVIPDYFEKRPKPCVNGWGRTLLAIAPDGLAMPCHGARKIPQLPLPNVREHSLDWIWQHSPAFNRFRGDHWMPEPCRSCPEKSRDFGGCRCQAYLLTGSAENTDPICDRSAFHESFKASLQQSQQQYQKEKFEIKYRSSAPNIIP